MTAAGESSSTNTGSSNNNNNGDESLVDPYHPEEDEDSTFQIITITAANYRDNTWRRHARGKLIVNLPKAYGFFLPPTARRLGVLIRSNFSLSHTPTQDAG